MGSSTRHSTSRAICLRPSPRIVRGSLVHVIGDVAFIEFRRATCAWSALEEALQVELQRKQLAHQDETRASIRTATVRS